MCENKRRPLSLKEYFWQYSYKTSALSASGKPIDILHDFYIPALRRAARYDRVAGYFRSSSLAAASQGFSAFTGHGGQMRLVMGADLDEGDVAAIIKGDTQRLAARLNEELDTRDSWPEDVTRGVDLLAWMVVQGHLEAKVAFRVHKETGEPMSFADLDDGYVHEKWAVFSDGEGNRLYITGSLNESKNALVHNAENIDVHCDWWGEIENARVLEAEAAFENIWNDNSPYLKVMSLPEAVEKNLVQIGRRAGKPTEIDGTTCWRPEVEPPSAMERLRFALIKDGPRLPGGRYVGIETAPVTPWPHQEIVARRLVQTWPYSYLLCDEVGLGKTIEAGLAIRSLYLSGLVRRVLVAPPASLTRQWHREMASKFFLPFARAQGGQNVRHEYIFPHEETCPSEGIFDPGLSIVSTGLLQRKGRQNDLLSAEKFDIALVDEAHYARRKNPSGTNPLRADPRYGNLYNAIQRNLRQKTSALWLATATPMQLDWIEVFDLIQLTHRVSQFQFDPTLMGAYYESLGALVHGNSIKEYQWDFLRRSIQSIQKHDPFLQSYLNTAVIDGRIRLAADQWLTKGRVPKGKDRHDIQRLIFAASPLSRVMLRHTRSLLKIYRDKGKLQANLATRNILPVPRIVFTPLEKKAYDELETYCRNLSKKIKKGSKGSTAHGLGFLLSFFRLRFASSLFAISETIKRRLSKVIAAIDHVQDIEEPDTDLFEMELDENEDEDLNERVIETFLKDRTLEDLKWERDCLTAMKETLADLSGTPSKMKELLAVLDKRRINGSRVKQTVIFTRFFDTLTDIVHRLRHIDGNLLIGTYSGAGGQYVDPRTKLLRGVDREEIKHRFLRGEIDVLVCTDAAAEGLNLQSADLLINFDLPWNPMKVEQRIGRIDRIGQKHDKIYVLNLCYVDSAEQIVYERLLKRLQSANYIVGTQQFSMLPVTLEEFNELASGDLSPDVLEVRAKERITLNRKRTESMEIPASQLFDIYARMSSSGSKPESPVSLHDIWQVLTESKYLRDLGCTVSGDTDKPYMALHGIDAVAERTTITADRALYDQGMPDSPGSLHFAGYGDPCFDAILDHLESFELPPCVVRLVEQVDSLHAEVVAFAVSCINESGEKQIRLVKSWSDLNGILLDEDAVISEEEIKPVKKRFHQLIREEFDPTKAVSRLEAINREAASCHNLFILLAAHSLIAPINAEPDDNFWEVLKGLDILKKERDVLDITDLPVDTLKKIGQGLLFQARIPQAGSMGVVKTPVLFVSSAIDAACRIADGMRKKRSELTIQDVQKRIQREIINKKMS